MRVCVSHQAVAVDDQAVISAHILIVHNFRLITQNAIWDERRFLVWVWKHFNPSVSDGTRPRTHTNSQQLEALLHSVIHAETPALSTRGQSLITLSVLVAVQWHHTNTNCIDG